MSAKTSAARREAFFRALSETGNQTISAERARVSRSWVSLHRGSDPAFRARMEACTVEARERLAAATPVLRPGAKWRYLDGEELIIRGTNGRRAQIARARVRQWTDASERDFLRTLAATANVRASCKDAGLSVASAYIHRSKYNEFGDRWEEALDIAETRLDFALVDGCSNFIRRAKRAIDCDGPMPTSFDQVFMVLQARKRELRNPNPRCALPKRMEDIRESILKKIRAIQNAGELAGK